MISANTDASSDTSRAMSDRRGPGRLARSTATAMVTGLMIAGAAAPVAASTHDHDGPNSTSEPASFTSMFSVAASDGEVPDGGEPGATGRFDLRLDAASDTICFDIVLDGVTPPYESPANTATHIHEAPRGEPGPPRVVFPDPEMHEDGTLTSSGCITSPWMTGVGPDDGGDHGDAFSVAGLEADPSAYYVDTHTTEFVGGAVRGQFGTPVPMGGMETGDGSTSTATAPATATSGATAAGGLTAQGPATGLAGLLGVILLVGLATVSARGVRRSPSPSRCCSRHALPGAVTRAGPETEPADRRWVIAVWTRTPRHLATPATRAVQATRSTRPVWPRRPTKRRA